MSALSSVGTAAARLTVSGLATGLDTDKLIEGLTAIEQSRIARLRNRQAGVTAKQTAFKAIETRLLALQGQLTQLGRSQANVFDGRTVATSDEAVLTGAASSSASPGVYTLRVTGLARVHQVASQGFEDAGSTITKGTVAVGLGAATKTLTIDDTNNTLSGLAAAINGANVGVTASIVKDGSGQPYRLLLAATKTGAANTIAFTNNLAADVGGARRPEVAGNYVGAAVTGAGFTGTAAVASNTGAGGYTGTTNNRYTFTVQQGGTVGTDGNITLAYADSTGANTGTIALGAGDADVLKDVAQGIRVKLGAGTLVAGETFTVDAYVSTVQQAADATILLGSGSGALTATSDTNRVDGLLGGVTLNLLGADPNRDVTVTVANDTEKATKAITDFVAGYNDLMEFIDQLVRYDPATNQSGILLGDRSILTVQDQVRRVLSEPVAGLPSAMNRLGALGITFDDRGRLAVNDGKLGDALEGRRAGVTLQDVRRLFALTGESSNPGIQFVTGSNKTKASTAPYQVDITQAATQAALTAGVALDEATTLLAGSNTFTVKVDGRTSGTITLEPRTYTRLALAQAVQAQINADGEAAGRRVTVSVKDNKLVISSAAYGRASEVAVLSGPALAALKFAGGETATGADVAGSFVVDGQTEAATGNGQILAGAPDNASTADLQVRVTLAPAQVAPGADGTVAVTRGLATKLGDVLGALLDPVSGRLKSIDDGFQDRIDDLKKSIDRQTAAAEAKRQALVLEFAALEKTVSQLKATGDQLAAQLATMKLS